jgi:hypothetical protein
MHKPNNTSSNTPMRDARQQNREAMPNVAALLDEFRKANPGLEIKVTYAKDEQTGVEVGTPMDLSNSYPIPANIWKPPSPVPPVKPRKNKR